MNPRWNIWVHSSVNKYLKTTASDNGDIPIILEGVDDRTEDYMAETDRVEARITGPHVRQMSRNYFLLLVEINVLVTNDYGGVGDNRFEQNRIVGVFQDALEARIPIYKFGTTAEDDSSLLGCLSPELGDNDLIQAFHFGQVNATDRKKQAVVDGKYYMNLRE